MNRGLLTFDEFYAAEFGAIALVAGATAGSWALGEELAQEAFARAHQDWERIRDFDRPGAWVRRVAINLALNAKRRDANEKKAIEQLPLRPASALDPAAFGDNAELWEAIAVLSPKQRAALVLHYHGGYSTAEIADLVDSTVSAVTTSMHKARTRLAKILGARA